MSLEKRFAKGWLNSFGTIRAIIYPTSIKWDKIIITRPPETWSSDRNYIKRTCYVLSISIKAHETTSPGPWVTVTQNPRLLISGGTRTPLPGNKISIELSPTQFPCLASQREEKKKLRIPFLPSLLLALLRLTYSWDYFFPYQA
jgi:hypothetical protein